jgi:hypothetical protein
LEDAMVLGDEVLVGQTALGKLDLMVDCAGQRLIPNPAFASAWERSPLASTSDSSRAT